MTERERQQHFIKLPIEAWGRMYRGMNFGQEPISWQIEHLQKTRSDIISVFAGLVDSWPSKD